MKIKIVKILLLTSAVIMLGLVVRVFVFWFHHDELTNMQLMKTIPYTYLGLLLNWLLLIVLQFVYLYFKRKA